MNFLYKKSQFLLKKWVKMSFPDHGVNKKVVDNHLINITGKFEPSSNSIFREIGK